MSYTKIENMEQLKELSTHDENENMFECFIALGMFRSSKRITYFPDEDKWDIDNEIDDVFLEEITTKELGEQTNVITALEKGALYSY